jgi:hypothetical protein
LLHAESYRCGEFSRTALDTCGDGVGVGAKMVFQRVVELVPGGRGVRWDEVGPVGEFAGCGGADCRPGSVAGIFEGFFDFAAGSVFVDEDHPQEEHPQRIGVGPAAPRVVPGR